MNMWNVANLCILGDNARPTLLWVCLLKSVLHVLQRVLKNPDAHSLHMLAISLPRTTSASCPAIKISWAGSRPQSHNTYYLVKEECILFYTQTDRDHCLADRCGGKIPSAQNHVLSTEFWFKKLLFVIKKPTTLYTCYSNVKGAKLVSADCINEQQVDFSKPKFSKFFMIKLRNNAAPIFQQQYY